MHTVPQHPIPSRPRLLTAPAHTDPRLPVQSEHARQSWPQCEHGNTESEEKRGEGRRRGQRGGGEERGGGMRGTKERRAHVTIGAVEVDPSPSTVNLYCVIAPY